MLKKKIYVVEDDSEVRNLIRFNLEQNNYEVFSFSNAEDALKSIEKIKPSLIILDIMLPGIDGFEFCKIIRGKPDYNDIPIIFLTSKGDEIDRIVGFELGADDYIVKPFSPRELLLRIKNIFKRLETTITNNKEVIIFKTLKIDKVKHQVLLDDKEIELTPIEFKILSVLLERKDRVQTRDKLLNDIWQIDSDINTRTIDVHIRHLRQKLGKYGDNIKTIRSFGYKFSSED